VLKSLEAQGSTTLGDELGTLERIGLVPVIAFTMKRLTEFNLGVLKHWELAGIALKPLHLRHIGGRVLEPFPYQAILLIAVDARDIADCSHERLPGLAIDLGIAGVKFDSHGLEHDTPQHLQGVSIQPLKTQFPAPSLPHHLG